MEKEILKDFCHEPAQRPKPQVLPNGGLISAQLLKPPVELLDLV